MWSKVLGLDRPQVLTAEIGGFADVLVVTTERSRQSEAATTCGIVHTVSGIAHMGRLENWRPVPHDGIDVGYLGLVSPVKMHPRFAEMCARVPDRSVSFVIVGSGGGEQQLHGRAVDLSLDGRFACTGYSDGVSSALGTFDIFGYPLSIDTYATSEKALQEAMWVGISPRGAQQIRSVHARCQLGERDRSRSRPAGTQSFTAVCEQNWGGTLRCRQRNRGGPFCPVGRIGSAAFACGRRDCFLVSARDRRRWRDRSLPQRLARGSGT